MTNLLRKFLTVVPVGVLLAAGAFAQNTTAFEGDVKGPDGKPLPGAQIRIERQDVKGIYKVKTDKKGHYFYGGLPVGNYKVIVEFNGKDADAMSGRGRLGDVAKVDFDLTKLAGGGAAAPPPDESGRALSSSEKASQEEANKKAAAAMAKNKALNDAFNLAKTAAAANDWTGAIDGFTKASEVDANQHVVWGNLGDVYMSRAKAAPATKDADYGKAMEAYQKAIALKTDDAAYHNNYALALAQMKKPEEAQNELNKAAQLDPANAGKYYYNLGAVYVNIGNTDPAIASFKKAIEIDPNYGEAYFQYGVSLMGKATTDPSGKMIAPPGTSEAFQKYLELAPTGPNAQAAKDMLTAMGSTVDTNLNLGKGKAPAKKK